MKKLLLVLIASFAVAQTAHAIPSRLNESLRVITALESSDQLTNAISQSEYIVEIKRKTPDLQQTSVFYEIKTVAPKAHDPKILPQPQTKKSDDFSSSSFKKKRFQIRKYIAELKFTPNEQMGPDVLEIVSITPKK